MNIPDFFIRSAEETAALIRALCRIPAPSGDEGRRAEFCRDWLCAQGAEGVYIDSALNTVYPINCEGRDDIVLFIAHTDTVFPDTDPMPFSRDGEYLYSPGVGDDTACLAILLMAAKYAAEQKLTPPCGIIFAANSGEEGLGNLKGIRKLMEDYSGRIRRVYTFDGQYDALVNRCVGSHRYEITLKTQGGHSFNSFGNPSAVHELCRLACRLCECDIPVCGESKTTYNIGRIEGGTSVNTIAQSARMMYEYRSDSMECLLRMQRFFEDTLESFRSEFPGELCVDTLGIRPCGGDVDEAVLREMSEKVIGICQKHSGMECVPTSGSTDCNIPMSLGIPAVCVGVYLGDGAHTREERVLIDSIPVGLKIAAELILGYFGIGKP